MMMKDSEVFMKKLHLQKAQMYQFLLLRYKRGGGGGTLIQCEQKFHEKNFQIYFSENL